MVKRLNGYIKFTDENLNKFIINNPPLRILSITKINLPQKLKSMI